MRQKAIVVGVLLCILMHMSTTSTGTNNLVFEGCGNAVFIFERSDPNKRADPLTINFSISNASTAVAGVDFDPLPESVTIPSGDASTALSVNFIVDDETEDIESLILEVEEDCDCKLIVNELQVSDVKPFKVSFMPMDICVDQPVQLEPVVDGGLPEYTYEWSTGDATSSIEISFHQPTPISVKVTDACGHSGTAETVIEPMPLPAAKFARSAICTGNPTADVEIELTGVGPWEVTYTIDNGPLQVVSDIQAKPFILSVEEGGVYELVSVRGSGGCLGPAVGINYVEFIPFSMTDQNSPARCFGASDGVIDLVLQGGARPYRFTWDKDLPDQEDHSGVEAGNYLVTVTDAAGCTITSQTQVDTPQVLTSSIRLRGNDCTLENAIIDLTVQGGAMPYSYRWGHVAENIEDPGGVTPGTFQVEITDANDCVINDEIIVKPPTLPVASIDGVTMATCDDPTGGSIQMTVLNGTAPMAFNWNDGIASEEDPVELTAGPYEAKIVDAIGCKTEIATVVPGDFATPVAEAGRSTLLDCPNIGVPLNGFGSSMGPQITYAWTSQEGYISEGDSSLVPRVHDPGLYHLVVKDTVNGCFAVDSVLVGLTVNAPYVRFGAVDTFSCYTSQRELDATASNANSQAIFTWGADTLAGNVKVNGSHFQAFVDRAGKYFLKIERPNENCYHRDSLLVPADTLAPIAFGGNNGEINCHVPEVTLGGFGSSKGPDFIQQWSSEQELFLSDSSADSITVDQEGVYYFTVTNTHNGCSSTDEVMVINSSPRDLIATVNPPRCAGELGSIEIFDVVGGVPPYYFSFDEGSFNPKKHYDHLEPGYYSIEIKDGSKCGFIKEIELVDTPPLEIKVENKQARLTMGDKFSPSVVTSVEEEELRSVNWWPSNFLSCTDCLNPEILPTSSMDYELTITNQNGCVATESINLIVEKKYSVYFPNAFAPYTSANNSRFFIQARGDIVREIRKFQVITRWGDIVHEARHFMPNDPQYGWDGMYLGRRLDPGVLLYKAEIEFIDGETKVYTGDLTLMD